MGNSLSGPPRLDTLLANECLEIVEQLPVRSNRVRRLISVQGETRQASDGLADSPLDRMQTVAAAGEVRRTDVLAGREQIPQLTVCAWGSTS